MDVLAGGRAGLGIGAAWFEEEAEGLGFAFPPLGERFERLEETLQICLQSGEDEGAFEGRHYRLRRTLNSPAALSRPHPFVLVGGGGERKTLRLVAQYANACNIFGGGDQARHKLNVLRSHCETVGRDYDEIEKTTMISSASPPRRASCSTRCAPVTTSASPPAMSSPATPSRWTPSSYSPGSPARSAAGSARRRPGGHKTGQPRRPATREARR